MTSDKDAIRVVLRSARKDRKLLVGAYCRGRLMAEDEEQTLYTFSAHKQIFESLVALHRGRIFNTAGDAILAEFGQFEPRLLRPPRKRARFGDGRQVAIGLCRGGFSHRPDEYASPEAISNGVLVLAEALAELANS